MNTDSPVSTHDTAVDNRDEAKVSVCASGFMLSDGVCEGLSPYRGHIPFLAEHLVGLFEAALDTEVDIGKTRDELIQAIHDILTTNNVTTDVHIRMKITLGTKKKNFQHPHLGIYGPTTVIIAEHSKPDERVVEHGFRLASVPHHIGLPLTPDPFGFAETTNGCTFFIARKGTVRTSTGDHCRNETTRQKGIDLCRATDISVFKRKNSAVDTNGTDDAFLPGTFGAWTPVFEIDGRFVEGNKAGPVFSRIRAHDKDEIGKGCT